MDTVRWCERELLSFEPDIVVVFQGVNDLCWNGGPGYTGQEGADTWQGIARKEWHGYPAWKRWLRWGSQTYRHIAAVRNRLRIRAAMRSGVALEWHSGAMPALRARYRGWPYRVELVRNPDPFDEFSRGMARLLGFLRQHAIAAVVLTQPVLWRAEMEPSAQEPLWMTVATPEGPVRPDPRWLTAEMARYNDRQRQIAAEYGAQVVALDEQIPRTTRLFIDDCHFTDAGHRLAAELIHPALRAAIEAALR
jgi:lysophospholipase L1-like esterase